MYRKLLNKSYLNTINCIKTQHRQISALQNNINDKSESYKRLLYVNNIDILQKRNISLQGLAETQQKIFESIYESSLVAQTQETLLFIHNTTGIPWWLTIISSTILARTIITFPLAIYQNRIMAKVENISLELTAMGEEMKKEAALAKKMFNLTDKQTIHLFQHSIKKQWKNLILRDNCHPLKGGLLIWFQIPLWISFSFSLRKLIDSSPEITREFTTGGFAWITDLTAVDPYFIMPVLFGIINLTIIEVVHHSRVRKPSRFQKGLTIFFRGFSVLMIPMAATVPSCMCLYWLTSSSVGLAHNLILLSPKFRRFVGIPYTPSEIAKPYTNLKNVACEKLHLK